MTRIILHGCCGKMGRVITAAVAGRCDCKIVAGIDQVADPSLPYPVYTSAANCTAEADVLVDFSHASALGNVLAFAESHTMPAVIATTGMSDEQKVLIRALSEKLPVFFTANMSLGVNLLAALVKKAAMVLGADFDIEIIEKHHNQKIDAPSGTAFMLAEAAKEGLAYDPVYVFDRSGRREPRRKEEIGFSSVRGGTIVGDHEVLFAGHDEVLTLSHSAASKELFAIGAINAALFLQDKPAGLYTMQDLVAV
ncbi:MAG: 4-hydroxy-tetrahydrodipicolinate reductase [Oscillospiraceae bacterium]|nr:4-hydroxy-tetrahydrodipicolinate reductase [Oscillospiraceae bacterium]